jgi:type II secretion system protein I
MRLRKGNSRASEGGFTLFEVVAAITVLAIGISAVFASFHAMSESTRVAERRTEAGLIARNVVAMVRTKVLAPKSEENEGEVEGTDYRYKVVFAETDWQKLYAVTVQIEWGPKEQPEQISVNTLEYED